MDKIILKFAKYMFEEVILDHLLMEKLEDLLTTNSRWTSMVNSLELQLQ